MGLSAQNAYAQSVPSDIEIKSISPVPIQVNVDITSGYPIGDAFRELRDHMQLPISISDISVTYAADYTDWGTIPAAYGVFPEIPGPNYRLVPANLVFSFTYTPDDPYTTAREASDALVVAYNALNLAGQYEVRESEGRFALVPTHVHDASGAYAAFVPSLEQTITLPHKKVRTMEAIRLILAAVDDVTPQSVTFGSYSRVVNQPVKIGGTATARTHLTSVFVQEENTNRMWWTYLWSEICETNDLVKGCQISIEKTDLKPLHQTAKNEYQCGGGADVGANAANAVILRKVLEISGASDYTCRPEVYNARSSRELWQYGEDYGWDGTTFADVNVSFNVEGTLELRSPCAISVQGDDNLLSITEVERVCLNGRKGVELATDAVIPVGADAEVEFIRSSAVIVESAEGSVVVGSGLRIDAGHVRLASGLDVEVKSSATILSPKVDVVANRSVIVEDGARIKSVAGALSVVSQGTAPGDGVTIGNGVNLLSSDNDVSVQGPRVTIGSSTVTAQVTVIVEADTCEIGAATLVGEGEVAQSGSCICADPSGCNNPTDPVPGADTAAPGDTGPLNDTGPMDNNSDTAVEAP